MRNRNRYRQYLSIEALVILFVLASFRFIPDRQIAAVVASSLFLLSTVGIIYWEMQYEGYQKKISFYALMGFLFLSVLPVMALRFMNWGVPFEQLSIGPLTGPQIHQFSNYFFIALMIAFFIDSHLEQVKSLQRQHADQLKDV